MRCRKDSSHSEWRADIHLQDRPNVVFYVMFSGGNFRASLFVVRHDLRTRIFWLASNCLRPDTLPDVPKSIFCKLERDSNHRPFDAKSNALTSTSLALPDLTVEEENHVYLHSMNICLKCIKNEVLGSVKMETSFPGSNTIHGFGFAICHWLD